MFSISDGEKVKKYRYIAATVHTINLVANHSFVVG